MRSFAWKGACSRMLEKGSSLLSFLVSLAIVGILFLVYIGVFSSLRRVSLLARDKLRAGWYATELLEVFRAHGSRQLRTYLSTNPIASCVGCPPYPLCTYVNILDRGSDVIANPDPLAGLPDQVNIPGLNRYYMVQVADFRNLAVNPAYCTRNASQVCIEGDPCASLEACVAETLCASGEVGLSSHERFLLTVGVSWNSQTVSTTQNLTLSAILPDVF